MVWLSLDIWLCLVVSLSLYLRTSATFLAMLYLFAQTPWAVGQVNHSSLYWCLGRATVKVRRNFSLLDCYYLSNHFWLFISFVSHCLGLHCKFYVTYACTLDRKSVFWVSSAFLIFVEQEWSTLHAAVEWFFFLYFLCNITFKCNHSIYLLVEKNYQPLQSCCPGFHHENGWSSHGYSWNHLGILLSCNHSHHGPLSF